MTREDWLALGQVVDWAGKIILKHFPGSNTEIVSLYPPIKYIQKSTGERPSPVPAGYTYIVLTIGMRLLQSVSTYPTWTLARHYLPNPDRIIIPQNMLASHAYGSLDAGAGFIAPAADDRLDSMAGIPTWAVFAEGHYPMLICQSLPAIDVSVAVRVLAVQLPADLYAAILADLDPRRRRTKAI